MASPSKDADSAATGEPKPVRLHAGSAPSVVVPVETAGGAVVEGECTSGGGVEKVARGGRGKGGVEEERSAKEGKSSTWTNQSAFDLVRVGSA